MSVIDSLSLGGTTYSLRDNDGRAIIAGTESSTTSAHAYSAGDYFILNDTLYEATAAIAVGGTITVGTNCQATTVCGEVGELKSEINDLPNTFVSLNGENQVEPQNIDGVTFTKETTETEGDNIFDSSTMLWAEGKYVIDYNGKVFPVNSSGRQNAYCIPVDGVSKYVFPQCRFALLADGNTTDDNAVGSAVSYATEINSTGGTYLFLSYDTSIDINTVTVKPIIVTTTYTDFAMPEWSGIPSLQKEIGSVSDILTDAENLSSALTCPFVARFAEYASFVGNTIYFRANTSGSNVVNVYIPVELGAYYEIDYGNTSALEAYGFKMVNSISDTYQTAEFSTGTSITNDGTNNKYICLKIQVISTYTGTAKCTVRKVSEKSGKIRVGNGFVYTSILSALKNTPDDLELLLVDEEYDVQAEYVAEYGADFWDNYVGYSGQTDVYLRGYNLTGNRKITGCGNPVIKMQYTGNNDYVQSDFSVFAFSPYRSTVEIANLMVLYSNIRYAIHDDFAPQFSTVIMRNLIIDGSAFSSAAIGSGLGYYTNYVIDGCVFLNNSKTYDISYHGSTSGLSANKCSIIVKNCFGTQKCAFRWYGASESVTDCVVHNSKFGAIECVAYDSSQPYENMRLIAYNNEIA